ncbi:hypothetical protein [Marinobacter sp. LQ44]|uniref:hypothetical protein n=1 Tax=unclassified Marinobacter TaxID=83889 RepID=UPI0022283283|nr:hypothetical protein [Marinobacter sp. LQ44]
MERLVTLLPIRHVADLVGLHWHTVKTIDKRRLQRDLPAPDPTRLRHLMMDEFARTRGSATPPWLPAPTPNRRSGSEKGAPARRFVRSSSRSGGEGSAPQRRGGLRSFPCGQ